MPVRAHADLLFDKDSLLVQVNIGKTELNVKKKNPPVDFRNEQTEFPIFQNEPMRRIYQ